MHLEALRFPITPLFVLIHFDVPYFAGVTDAYSFTISGRVRAPMTVTLGELKARPTVRQPTIMECAGVGRSAAHPRAIYVPWQYEPMGVYEYTGTPLRPLLEEAGLLDDAVEVVFTGHDEGIDLGVRHNFERALPVKGGARRRRAAGVGGERPGAPAAPRVPAAAHRPHLVRHDERQVPQVDHGHRPHLPGRGAEAGLPRHVQLERRWPPDIPDAISRHRFVSRGPTVLEGKAWSGQGQIVRVEVSTDDRQTWRPATLQPPVSPFAWTPWTFTWDVRRRGEYIVSSRALDSAGNIQPLRAFWNVQGMAQNGVERIGVTVQ